MVDDLMTVEVFLHSTMGDDLSKKVDKILLKLQELKDIEQFGLNDAISTVSSIKETMPCLEQDVEALKKKSIRPTRWQRSLKKVLNSMMKANRIYCTKNITTE